MRAPDWLYAWAMRWWLAGERYGHLVIMRRVMILGVILTGAVVGLVALVRSFLSN